MKNLRSVLCFIFLLRGQAFGCFHGWISQSSGNGYPTGYCQGKKSSSEKLSSHIEVDFPTQRLYIHGSLRPAEGYSIPFKYDVITCRDTEEGWTIIHGVNDSTGEKYSMKHREMGEVPPTGQAKQAFEGEALLSVEIGGRHYHADLSCVRYVF